MKELVLDVRLDGFDAPIGVLARDAKGAMAFAYTDAHLKHAAPAPLSLSLPLGDDAFSDEAARPYFENLLQERDGALKQVMDRENLSRDDIAGLLFHLGRDCAGAVSVLPQGAAPSKVPGDLAKDYETLSDAQMEELVRALHTRAPLPDHIRDPSPLSGVQSKIALTRLPGGEFAKPREGSGAPTTHIIKAPDERHKDDAIYENAAMTLSDRLLLRTADAAAVSFGEVKVLLTRRFDRAVSPEGRVTRIHQEDFAQALGLPPSLKYERYGEGQRIFNTDAIARVIGQTSDPKAASEFFVRASLFDILIGNVDGHAKNFALLHEAGAITMAPRYDVMPTRLDPKFTPDFAFKVGAAENLDSLKLADLEAFGRRFGVALDDLTNWAASYANDLCAAFGELDRMYARKFANLIADNVETLLKTLKRPVPDAVKDRDAFVGKGGGWSTS
ncbi:MAG: HipA domain-containing protein [Phycisphaerales bacterium]|nr:HipA domain-containing protein [Hyphomonadaceae bacterium]